MATTAKYDALWSAARARFLDGALQTDREPVDGDPRWGMSLVVLPDRETAEVLERQSAALDTAYRGKHHLTARADLHATVTSLEPYRETIAQHAVDHYVAAVEGSSVADDLRIRLRGLGGSTAGVFVQGFDDGTLLPLRQRMHAAAAALHHGAAPPMAFVRDTAHVSLSVHRQAIPEPAVVELVERSRNEDFGVLCAGRLALVAYRSRPGGLRLEVLHTFHGISPAPRPQSADPEAPAHESGPVPTG
ncbi:hypothetical protein [Curtobacterium sp. 9128]|uniref:hypothetical protein n=1 Tax=Curtobacterium sp. 9128 TaxID=1793722 RepID=UPI0024820AA2|nr:hypothetical protein [Curtobacterium sp. 9128]